MKYSHNCPEWDEMMISEADPEFMVCQCFERSEEIDQLKSKLELENDI
jgi:hypothetical protein